VNAGTFHQIDAVNTEVQKDIAENGGAYVWANRSMHVSAWSLEAAGAVYAWGALGGSQAGIGVKLGGEKGAHFLAGAGGRGILEWIHGIGPRGHMWIVQYGRTAGTGVEGYYCVTGIPILSATNALTVSSGYNCLTVALKVILRGLVPSFF
jgi:hypothetical protein